MKIIGLIGGMSWESTTLYYRVINQTVARLCGGHHSARLLMYSVNSHDVWHRLQAGAWDEVARILVDAARRLEDGGADCVLLGCNSVHKVASQVAKGVRIPLLHIADATAQAVLRAGLRCVGLLGTRFTMEEDFLRQRLAWHGLEVRIPEPADRAAVHAIAEELCLGRQRPESRQRLLAVMDRLGRDGAEGMILGCTELPLLVRPEDTRVPVFSTTELHALAAAEWSVGDRVDRPHETKMAFGPHLADTAPALTAQET